MIDIKNRWTGKQYVVSTPETRIKFKDIFDAKELYVVMHDWLVEQDYAPSNDTEFPEIFYHHRWHQGGLEEIRFWWRLSKEKTSYYKYEIDINNLTIGLKPTEVVKGGQKFKAHSGEVEIKVFGRVILDYKEEWRNHMILKHFNTFFQKRIFWKEIEMKRIELYRDIYRFMEFLKTHFKLIKYREEPEGEEFFPTKDFD